ncbi:tetratricopeptide repeat protein [Jidongwangia harbinensis]|uniref:tetratricopeptide repeat protein n=1 Tax=Jidongwangia harbinensis TaxID=2878561 RepID=UPI001CD9A6A7|nr:tetratricopeptide repeat protein [Jidongwangia harbinensis]MCA2216268.1 tetratricopeptide repeat protein [Jidongwangia harbinensis]MCA2217003.1 tetratricopeptide repeat protein [Jidongwangia harbinensis]
MLSAFAILGFRFDWWKAFTDPGEGVWPWVEVMSWIVGMTTGTLSLILSFRGAGVPAPAPPATATAPTRDPTLLDREKEYDGLYDLFKRDLPPGVVRVVGLAGFGKTKVVDSVLGDLEKAGVSLTVYRHVLTPGLRFDVRTLIGDLEGLDEPAELHPGETRLARLRLALRNAGLTRIVIVIESAEHLAVPDGRHHVDLQVDEALEAIYRHELHRATVVLVSRDALDSSGPRLWTQESATSIGKLPRAEFRKFLTDRDAEFGKIPEARHAVLYDRLNGNPRCGQLMLAIVALAEPSRALGINVVADTIVGLDPLTMPRRLAGILVENLEDLSREVIEAVAAFRTTMDAVAIAATITAPVAPSVVIATLQRFEKHELVRRIDDGYCLTFADADWFLPVAPAARSALLRRVAEVLRSRLPADPRSLDDLRMHFAYVAVLMEGRRYPMAYAAMESMTGVLKRWNCGHLLLAERKTMQGKIGIPGLEMLNDNELGHAYASVGDFDAANIAYGRALDEANKLSHPEISATIRYNFGTYYWLSGRADLAYNYYEEARKEARQQQLPAVLRAALKELAECHHRWGQYDRAFARANEALALADGEPIGLLLRIARWRVETGDTGAAGDLIRRARAAARDSEWHLAACHEAEADRLLATGSFGGAGDEAATALEQAVQTNNAVVVLQARTTLCWAALYAGKPEEARRHIEDAEPYRAPRSALAVPALNALLHQKSDPAKAADLFRDLADEAGERVRDENDRGARDMLGFAIAALSPQPEAALEYLVTPDCGASVLRARRDFLLNTLAGYAQPPGRLQPLLDALASNSSRPTD